MAGSIQLKKGTKMQLAFDVPVGQEPQFNMLCTFNKALDESAFLVSAPMVDGKRLVPDETQKLLFKYTEGDESNILAGYVDDVKRRNPSLSQSQTCGRTETVHQTYGCPYES